MTPQRSPVIVAGMHRSGTSLVASILAASGVDMGDRLLAADRNNPRGYFEDLEILDLQREMLHEATVAEDGGHRDWGWTESERLDRDRFADFTARARALIAAKSDGPSGFWGWKEPRTTLALDFWDALLDEARYVLVYRFPWEVADSMQRLGAEVFLRRPDYAYRIWAFYNRHLLDFYRRHRDRCLLLSTDALQNEPGSWIDLLRRRLELDSGGAQAAELLAPALFQRADPDDPLGPLAAATHPACAEILADLDRLADASSEGLWPAGRPVRYREPAEIRLSVVIPCFDQGEFLVEAVASVERSVPEPHELIIVNDGSRDPRTLEILEVLREAGYLIIDQENRGLAAARNRGIEQARTPYILPLDADNRLRPGFVGPALEILDAQAEVGVVYGDRRDFGLRSMTVHVGPFDLETLLASNFIDACAVLRKEVWSACGGYDPHMPAQGLEDWDFWLSVAGRGWQLHYLPIEIQDYRVRPGSMITFVAYDEVVLRRVERYVIAKHEDLYRRRLPELIAAAQNSATRLLHATIENERLRAENTAATASSQAGSARLEAQEAELEALNAARDTLAGERERLLQEIDALREERGRWEAERESFRRELKAWQERVASMEGTRAWRLRQRLVDLKQGLTATGRKKQMPPRPNILFVMADQMRADALGIVNGWTRTPIIDRLAREGFLLHGVITNSAECIPARFSLALGLYPHQTGVWQNGVYTLNPECPNWMQAVERAGYRTSLFGKTHLHPHEGDLRDRVHLMHAYGLQVVDETTGPHASVHVLSNMTQSWQEQGLWESYRQDMTDRVRSKPFAARPSVLGAEHHYDVYVGSQAARYLAGLEGPQPWFCWVSFGGPHEPWDSPEPYASLYAQTKIDPPIPRLRGHGQVRGLLRRAFDSAYYSPPLEPDEIRALRANYAGNVTLIDEQIGKILEVVQRRGELERTLIVFTSDHGEMNGDQGLLYKANFLDTVVQVPLVIRPPGAVGRGGHGLRLIAELMDVGATLVDYAGGSLAESSHARSLRPLIEGRSTAHRELAVCEFLDHTAILDQRWKIEFGPEGQPTLLFDRAGDPLEQVNLVDDRRYAGTITELRHRLDAFRAATPAPPVRATHAD